MKLLQIVAVSMEQLQIYSFTFHDKITLKTSKYRID